MARIPILKDPGQLNTGNQTQQTPNLPAVTNASLGKALGNIGEMAMDISEKAKRADDVTKLTEASMAMNKAQMEFATFQQSPEGQDEKQWLPKWQEMQTKLEQDFNATELTPEARLRLNDRFSDWSMRGTINTQANAFKKTGQRMEDSFKAVLLGDNFDAARQNIQDQVSGRLLTKEEGDYRLAVVDGRQKTKQLTELTRQAPELIARGNQGDMPAWQELKSNYDQQKDLGYISEGRHKDLLRYADEGEFKSVIYTRINGTDGMAVDLTRAAKMAEESDLPSQQKLEIMDDIEKARKRYANQDLLTFANNAASGGILNANDFDSKYMGPAELQETRAEINKATPISETEIAATYIQTLKQIDAIDVNAIETQNPMEVAKIARVALTIPMLPTYMRDGLSSALQAKLSNKEEDSIISDAQRKAISMMETIMKDKESQFFVGYGTERRVPDNKKPAYLEFQTNVWKQQQEVIKRIQAMDDTQKIDKVILDVLGKDYREAAKNPYRNVPLNPLPATIKRPMMSTPQNTSGFERPPTSAMNAETGFESQRYTRLTDGSYEGIASSYGYPGDKDNGKNSLGMRRGEQPWYGEMPTVALAPRMAEELGVQLPSKKKDGTWDYSKSIVEVEADGRKTNAIFDETGMYMVEASNNKLIDLTPEASDALGLPQRSNARVTVRKPTE